MRTAYVVVVLLGLALALSQPAFARDQVRLLARFQATPDTVVYSYVLRVDDPYKLVPGASQLRMLGIAHPISAGPAIGWIQWDIKLWAGGKKADITWLYTNHSTLRRYWATFDVEVGGTLGHIPEGKVTWQLLADDSDGGTTGTVVGPLADDGYACRVFVYDDLVENWRWDKGVEPGVPRVPVAIYVKDGGWKLLAVRETDDQGYVYFEGLEPAKYEIVAAHEGSYKQYLNRKPRKVIIDMASHVPDPIMIAIRFKRHKLQSYLEDGTITTDGNTACYWIHEIAAQLTGQPHNEDVYFLLAAVERIWLPEPFQFSDDPNGQGPVGEDGLREALAILLACPFCGKCRDHHHGGCNCGDRDDDDDPDDPDDCNGCTASNAAQPACHDHHGHHDDDRCCNCHWHDGIIMDCVLAQLLAEELNQRAGYLSSLDAGFQSLIAWETEYLVDNTTLPRGIWRERMIWNGLILYGLNGGDYRYIPIFDD